MRPTARGCGRVPRSVRETVAGARGLDCLFIKVISGKEAGVEFKVKIFGRILNVKILVRLARLVKANLPGQGFGGRGFPAFDVSAFQNKTEMRVLMKMPVVVACRSRAGRFVIAG